MTDADNKADESVIARDAKGKFLPGNPGGPGRPARPNFRTMLNNLPDAAFPESMQKLMRQIKSRKGGRALTREELIIASFMAGVADGDASLLRDAMDRLLGKPVQPTEVDLDISDSVHFNGREDQTEEGES